MLFLTTAAFAAAVYAVVQVLKPLLLNKLFPTDRAWQNAAIRVAVFAIAYALEFLQAMAQRPMSLTMAWLLVGQAMLVTGAAYAIYHLGDTTAPAQPVTSSGIVTPGS